MKYRPYIAGGIPVSEIGFGAWQLGVNSGWNYVSEKDAIRMVHIAIDHGVNFFDTAPNYGNGTSEERLHKAFKGMDRSKLVINSKFGRASNGTVDFSASVIRPTIEGSLKRLGVDYLDSVIIHSPPFEYLDGNKKEHYNILETLKQEGKIKAYGASIDSHKEIETLLSTTEATIIHAFYNIFHQGAREAKTLIEKKEATIVAKIPLDSGWLTGKYHKNSEFRGVRNRWSKAEIATRAMLVEKLKAIVGEHKSLVQVALAFCLADNFISSVIPGSVNEEQLMTNIKSNEKPLPEELVQLLYSFYSDEVAPQQLPW